MWIDWSSTAALLLLPITVSAITFDCDHVRVDEQSFDLHRLGGPKTVHWTRRTPPTIANTTFTIDVCNTLKRSSGVPKTEECPGGTRICGIERDYKDDGTSSISKVIPIAGQFALNGGHLDPEITRLKGSSNDEKEGLRVVLNGGKYPGDRTGQAQKAVIEFICDPKVTGTEGFDEEDDEIVDATQYSSMYRRTEDDGGDEDDALPDLDKGKQLRFISYKAEGEKEVGVLRLTWKTKYACEGAMDKAPEDDKKEGKSTGGWGFFTWFIIVVFLLAASYIIFGSWLNYNRYGARGWDLLPHGDTIRDLPYILKDWGSGVVGRLRGSGGSRGGYSAV